MTNLNNDRFSNFHKIFKIIFAGILQSLTVILFQQFKLFSEQRTPYVKFSRGESFQPSRMDSFYRGITQPSGHNLQISYLN